MDIKKSQEEAAAQSKLFADNLGEELKYFKKLHDTALEDGALDPKTKELIALGIAIAVKCDNCILSHVSSLVDLGATQEEINETVATAFFMGGGPSMAYGGKALKVYDELTKNK